MNSRQRVKLALNHQVPDRPPRDLGSTSVTGIQAGVLDKLRKKLGLEYKPVKVHHPFMLLGHVEEDLMEALEIDVMGVWGPYNSFGFKNDFSKTWYLPDKTRVLVGGDFNTTVDDKGNTYLYPKGDTSQKPSAVLPKDGYYFDYIIRNEPFDEDNYSGRDDFKEQYKVMNDEVLEHISRDCSYKYNNTPYALIGNFSGGGLGDLGQIPGPGLRRTPGLRRAEDWYMAHLLYPDYIKEVFEYQTEVALKNLALYKQACTNMLEAVFVSGTDFGTQRGGFFHPDIFRSLYKPYYKIINQWIHENTSWKTFYHSCGAISEYLDDMIDMGADIINPVQCSAAGMDPAVLKEKYKDKLVFWGGASDTQHTLPFGSRDEVVKEAEERVRIFSQGGGFIFSPIHNIQNNTPVENIIALFEV